MSDYSINSATELERIMDSVSPTSSGSSATQNTGTTSRNDATDHTATSATTAAVTGTTTVSQLAAAAQTGSPVDQGKALRALDGITKDPQATNALVAKGLERVPETSAASIQIGAGYSATAIVRAPEAAASIGGTASVSAVVNVPTSLATAGDAGVVASAQVAGGIGQGTFVGAGPSVQIGYAKQTEKTVLSSACGPYAEVDRKETQISTSVDREGVSSVTVSQGVKVPSVPSIPSVGTGGFAGGSCSVTVTLTPNAVANSAAAAKKDAESGVLAFTRAWVSTMMQPGMPSP
jgi:hypothetical protein